MASKIATHDGRSKHPLYNVWRGMMARCYNQRRYKFSSYGGAGISVDVAWHDFWQFAHDMSPRPNGCTLDRRDGALGYSKDNCRWASHAEQNCNRPHFNKRLEFNGESKTLSEWAAETGLAHTTLRWRHQKGWSAEQIITTPAANVGFQAVRRLKDAAAALHSERSEALL